MTLLYSLFKRKNQKISKTIITTSFNNAGRSMEDGRYEDALTIYNDLLKTVSKKKNLKSMAKSKKVKDFVTRH